MVETLIHSNPPCATISTKTDALLGSVAPLEPNGGRAQKNRLLKVTRPALDFAASHTAT